MLDESVLLGTPATSAQARKVGVEVGAGGGAKGAGGGVSLPRVPSEPTANLALARAENVPGTRSSPAALPRLTHCAALRRRRLNPYPSRRFQLSEACSTPSRTASTNPTTDSTD